MSKRFKDMRYELIEIAEKEATRLWRLARRAEKHGVSKEVINNIREEATMMYSTMRAYPERLLTIDCGYPIKFEYAFR